MECHRRVNLKLTKISKSRCEALSAWSSQSQNQHQLQLQQLRRLPVQSATQSCRQSLQLTTSQSLPVHFNAWRQSQTRWCLNLPFQVITRHLSVHLRLFFHQSPSNSSTCTTISTPKTLFAVSKKRCHNIQSANDCLANQSWDCRKAPSQTYSLDQSHGTCWLKKDESHLFEWKCSSRTTTLFINSSRVSIR